MINPDSVPSTVESAALHLAESLADDDREQLRAGQELDHFDAGLSIRNSWSIWEPDSPLKRDAVAKYGIAHADDVSGLIRAWAVAIVRGEPFDPVVLCDQYRDHWAKFGMDPLAAGGGGVRSGLTRVFVGVVKIGAEPHSADPHATWCGREPGAIRVSIPIRMFHLR